VLRRVVVISDGLANVGPSSPQELGDLAAAGTEQGVQVSAIGVGLDYDERTLGELARRTSGRLYHLEQPEQLAAILDQEVRLLSTTVATSAYLELSVGPGVEVDGAELADARRDGRAWRVKLGSLYAGQRREVLFRVKVSGEPGPAADLAKVRLVYQDRAAAGRWAEQAIDVRGALSADAAVAAASADARVATMVTRHEAAEAQRRAAEMLNQGRSQEAVGELQKAESKVDLAAKRAADPAERARLAAQAARIAESRAQYQAADSQNKKRAASLKSYGYSFSDDGLAAPQPSVPRPAARP
jgi:Ca-activated chloride channel family protein